MPRGLKAEWDNVRSFVVETLSTPGTTLATAIQQKFSVSRPTAHSYIQRLIDEEIIVREKRGRYALHVDVYRFEHSTEGLEEHVVWLQEVLPTLGGLRPNVIDIFRYGCTEMINNVIDHSESKTVIVMVERSPGSTKLTVHDRGIGIFRKIASSLGLEDDRQAVLELLKGKVTTDPERHSGEGVFFSSRVFDEFEILSGNVFFSHDNDRNEDWILGELSSKSGGTHVFMTMSDDSKTILSKVFDEHASETENYRFDKTVVPVKMMQYGDDHLVSRSQGKRLMDRFDRFRKVILNFEGVPTIGQAFADEVFRVFGSQHPNVEVMAINANEQVSRMIRRATAGLQSDQG